MYIFFMSLGCDKNLVDSEEMLGALVSHGFEVTDDESQADVIVVNTCCFIHDAKEESIQAILEMADYKTNGNLKALIVTGCLAQRYKEEITKEIPEVDAVLGTNSQAALLDAVDEALKGKVSHVFTPLEGIPQMPGKRMITTGGFYEYLKIAEGCNKHCTYCIIPKIRGNYRSVPMETLIEQAKQLAEQGVRELILVAHIHDAKEESIQAILEMADYKTNGNLKALIVTGCLAQRYKEEITKEIPEVDAVLGTNSQAALLDAVDEALKGKVSHVFTPLEGIPQMPGKRMITTGGFYEYLKIAEGCNKHCTYCIIPKIRGNYRSVPMETLIEQAKQLAEQGVRELILVAQETTIYGTDLYGKKSLHLLLKELCKIPGIVWIRVLYCYPEEIYPELIETIRDEKKICHYLDLPIQHASDKILKRMGRRTSKQQLIDMVSTLRREIPDIVLRTTLITGFPGETQEDHEELMEFVDQMEFDRLGVFTYSPEEDTPAATMEDQIPEEVKQDRQAELMELQQEISLERGESCVGKDYLVMIEGKVADENAYVGRTYADAPGIDGYMFINTGELLMSGDFVKAHVTGSLEYDLIGEIADEYTE